MFENLFFHHFKCFSSFWLQKENVLRKYLATNQEEETVGDVAETVAVIDVDAVDLYSMFENLFYHHFK